MTYACWNRDRPTGQGWKDDGAFQHDSAKEQKCSGCKWQRRANRNASQAQEEGK